MQHNSNTEFVMYVDNFLSIETLESLQETFINLKYSSTPRFSNFSIKNFKFLLPGISIVITGKPNK